MVFVTVDRCRAQLEGLTQLLISAFPGSTVYQHTELSRVPHDILNNRTQAVFLETDDPHGLDFVQLLRRKEAELPVFIISQTEALREKAAEAGATDYLVQPVTRQQLQAVLQAAGCVPHTDF